MTRSGSRAIVNRNKAMAGPNAMNVHPKNTDAVILDVQKNPLKSSATQSALSCSIKLLIFPQLGYCTVNIRKDALYRSWRFFILLDGNSGSLCRHVVFSETLPAWFGRCHVTGFGPLPSASKPVGHWYGRPMGTNSFISLNKSKLSGPRLYETF